MIDMYPVQLGLQDTRPTILDEKGSEYRARFVSALVLVGILSAGIGGFLGYQTRRIEERNEQADARAESIQLNTQAQLATAIARDADDYLHLQAYTLGKDPIISLDGRMHRKFYISNLQDIAQCLQWNARMHTFRPDSLELKSVVSHAFYDESERAINVDVHIYPSITKITVAWNKEGVPQ
jgi:hypothetical protein